MFNRKFISVITSFLIGVVGVNTYCSSNDVYAKPLNDHIELTITNEGKWIPPFTDEDAKSIWEGLGVEEYENDEWTETIAPNSIISIDWNKTTISKDDVVGIRLFSHYMYRDVDGTIGEKGKLYFNGAWADDDYIEYSDGKIWGGPDTWDDDYNSNVWWFELNRYKKFTEWVLSDDFKGFDVSKINELKDELLVLEIVFRKSDGLHNQFVLTPIEKEKYTFNSKNTPRYSNEWVNGKWYDINGQQTYEGTLAWCINGTGKWVEDTNGWYPVNEWVKIDGVWYYFKSNGYAAENEYYFGYWFNFDGTWNDQYFLTWKCNSVGWWVEDISGWWPSSSWLKVDGCWYYFNSKGYMVTNRYIDGYWIGADGVCR